MYDKQNANYGLYLAGMITEHQYYDLCEGKKAKKKVKAQDVNGDGKIDFIDVLASRMMASGMSKEEAIKKASAHAKKHKKKGMKKGMKNCMKMETTVTKFGSDLGISSANLATKIEPLFTALIDLAHEDKSHFMSILRIIKNNMPKDKDPLQISRIRQAIDKIESEEQEKE